MMFSILQPGRILFGRGEAARAPGFALEFGQRGLVVHGADPARASGLMLKLGAQGAGVLALSCAHEPTLDSLEQALLQGGDHAPDWVLAIGGGAVIDMGKALAALIPSATPVLDHLEVVGRGLPLTAPPLPFIALPSTAGTGAEVTKNAVIGVPGRKVSLRDDRMIARVAIIDPALTDGCPWPVTLASGLDAVTQVIEAFLSLRASPYTDALTGPVIGPGLAALMALQNREDPVARDTLAWTSLSGGLALANGGLGAVHGFAGVIGGRTGAAHGAICGTLLGPVLAMNRRLTTGLARARVDHVCSVLAGVLGCTADDAPQALADWAHDAGLPGLSAMGLAPADQTDVADASRSASSMKGNPVQPEMADLVAALGAAMR